MHRLADETQGNRSVIVKITDRNPGKHLLRGGHTIDLSRAGFERLADLALIDVNVRKP